MPDALSALTGGETAAPAPAPAATAAAPVVAPDATTAPAAAPAEPETLALSLPGKDATPEQWSEFYKAIGAPDKAEAYELPVPEGDDGAFAKTAAEWFKDAGLLPQQAQALASKWNEFATAQAQQAEQAEAARIQAMDTKNRAEEQSLKTEWGQAHEANMELAKRAVRQFIPGDKAPDVITALEDKLGYAETIKLLHSIGKGLGEHDAPGLGERAPARKDAASILYGGTQTS
jgi:hypothetical protein